MLNNIFILSEPIQTGKTTLLMNWLALPTQHNTGGILTPDIDGQRKLYLVHEKIYHHLQLPEGQQGIEIGRFVFDKNAFALAQDTLTSALNKNFDWIVVDEIGRLEMDRKEGLEPAITKVIEHFKQHITRTKLLLIIRDYLLKEALQHYGIAEATLLHKEYFLKEAYSPASLTGVVLCGGQSTRMGTDKAFIKYHQTEQVYHVQKLLFPLCSDVVISCNAQQKDKLTTEAVVISDETTFTDAGPMTGVLSVFQQNHNQALLVAGCDYPFLTAADIQALIEAREAEYDAICFKNEDGFAEPLLAIYEPQTAVKMRDYFNSGQTSLRHFLQTIRTKYILAPDSRAIKSVDSPADLKNNTP